MAQILNFPKRPDDGYHCGDQNCIACNTFETPDNAADIAKLLQEWRNIKDDDSLAASYRRIELSERLGEYGLFFLSIMGAD